MNKNILIGGGAGNGINTLSHLIGKILTNSGYFVFSNKNYMSRVRGGHNFMQIRFGEEPITSHSPTVDMIIALDKLTITKHSSRLSDKGVIICDNSLDTKDAISVPAKEIAKQLGNSKVFGTVLMAAALQMLAIQPINIEEVFRKTFDDETASKNVTAFERGFNLAEEHFEPLDPPGKGHIFLNGNQAIAVGALAAGVSFYSAYPMSPSTGIMSYLSKNQPEAGLVVEQAEDELAAINMAIGASIAGVRAMTGTSGGGFSLMTEGLGLAAVMETPLVIANVQRPGPATGLPTRTSQSDLSFVLNASQGEFPRMIIAVRNPEDAFYQTARAFNIADKYQIPVIILSDQYLADYSTSTKPFDLDKIQINRYLPDSSDIDEEEYQRYKLTPTGVSPRLIPGEMKDKTVLADSHEHHEVGYITEDIEIRNAMMHKRMGKLDQLRQEIQEPMFIGSKQPNVLLIGWGSTCGPLQEAVNLLQADGIKAAALVFGDLWPLPTAKLLELSQIATKIVNVEQNYQGQLAKLLRQETGLSCDHSILRYDGRPMSGQEIYTRLKEEVK